MLKGSLVHRAVFALIGLAVGGCASVNALSTSLTRLSEEGGLVGRALSGGESAEPGDTPAESAAAPGDTEGDFELPVPYRPADFREHAVDREVALHWTAARAGDRVEVKGLIENTGARPVRRVTLGLSSPDALVREGFPGLIRPGQARPFYFAAAFPGDERRARLSVVAVDRAPVEADAGTMAAATRRDSKPAPARSREEPFAEIARDHFFTLRWNTTEKGGEVQVSGLIENRNGPILRDVTLLISAHDAAGGTLKTERLLFGGPFDKREARSFAAALPVRSRPDRVSVSVESYRFYQPKW